jgi:hypothetical protein
MAGKTILKARARRSVAVMVEPTTERDETGWSGCGSETDVMTMCGMP